MDDLAGRVAFVTGGTTGIGLGIAKAMLSAEMKVVVASRQTAHLESAAKALTHWGTAAHVLQLDVTERDAMDGAADTVERLFGRVDVLCANAGAGVAVPVGSATHKDWDWALAVNVMGVINALQAFVPKIRAHGAGGHIVATSSMSGLFVGANAGVYAATKYAVVGMMEALRADLAPHDIGVSVYCPGVVNTDFHESEAGRPAQYAERRHARSHEENARIKELLSAGMDPMEAGELVLRGIRRNDLYILTHPEYAQGVRERFLAILASMPTTSVPPRREEMERSLKLLSNPVYKRELARQRHTPKERSRDVR